MHGPGGRGRAHREEDGGLLRGDAPAVHPGPPAAGVFDLRCWGKISKNSFPFEKVDHLRVLHIFVEE